MSRVIKAARTLNIENYFKKACPKVDITKKYYLRTIQAVLIHNPGKRSLEQTCVRLSEINKISTSAIHSSIRTCISKTPMFMMTETQFINFLYYVSIGDVGC